MTYRLPLLVLLVLASYHSSAQDRIKFISFETGIDFLDCDDVDKPYIRSQHPEYYSYTNDFDPSPTIQSQLIKPYVGVKVEVRSRNGKFGFLSGLRFTRLYSSIIKNGTPDYFYFRHQQTGTTTEYLRVKELHQASSYLGIPIEARFFPFDKKRFRFYVSAGTEIGVRLGTKNTATFKSSSMDQYNSDVSETVGKPGAVYSALYARAGFTIGKEKPWFNIGLTAPLVISSSTSSLTSPNVGGGIHLQFQKQF